MGVPLKLKISFIYILISLFSFSVFSQDWQGYIGPYEKIFMIQNIEVKGLGRVNRKAVLEKIDLKVGSIATNYAVRGDIEKLYSMGFFEQVAIYQAYVAGKKTLMIQ